MLGELGLSLSLEETMARFTGCTLRQSVQLIAQLLGTHPPADFVSRYGQRTRTALESELKSVPGVEDVLSGLRVPYCAASNGNRAKMRVTLGITGLLPRFEGRMYCAEDVENPKPAPDLFLYAASRHGVQPSRCLVIEDTPGGIAAARAAGMAAFGYAALTPADRLAEAGASIVFAAMHELPALLASHERDA